MEHQNPAIRMQNGTGSVQLVTHRIPYGGTPFETEANITCGTMTGQGVTNPISNLDPDLTVSSAVAGTSMGVISGGSRGVAVVLAACVGIDVAEGGSETVLYVPATVLPGWVRSPGPTGNQEIESFLNTMLFFTDSDHPQGGYPRGMSIRLFVIRSLP